MNKVMILAAGLILASSGAMADADKKPSDAEIEKVKAALAQLGCEGGDYDKEASGIIEVDDATCKTGEYDLKIDKDFNVILMSRD